MPLGLNLISTLWVTTRCFPTFRWSMNWCFLASCSGWMILPLLLLFLQTLRILHRRRRRFKFQDNSLMKLLSSRRVWVFRIQIPQLMITCFLMHLAHSPRLLPCINYNWFLNYSCLIQSIALLLDESSWETNRRVFYSRLWKKSSNMVFSFLPTILHNEIESLLFEFECDTQIAHGCE